VDRGEIDGRESSDAELAAEIWRLRRFGGLRSAFRPEVDLYRTEDPPELTVVVELAGS
jgi:HSP20 family molecular chaperone IbpA